jgi:hypothetical protein
VDVCSVLAVDKTFKELRYRTGLKVSLGPGHWACNAMHSRLNFYPWCCWSRLGKQTNQLKLSCFTALYNCLLAFKSDLFFYYLPYSILWLFLSMTGCPVFTKLELRFFNYLAAVFWKQIHFLPKRSQLVVVESQSCFHNIQHASLVLYNVEHVYK